MGKVKRTLSVVLAVAMVVTMVPQTGLTVHAEELDTVIEQNADETAVVDGMTTEAETSTPDSDDGEQVGEPSEEEGDVSSDAEDSVSTDTNESAQDVKTVNADSEEGISPLSESGSYTVTVSGGTGFTVTENGSGTATAGQDYTFKVKLDKYYENPTAEATVGDSSEPVAVGNASPVVEEDDVYTFTISGDTLTGLTAEGGTITVTVRVTEVAKYQLTVTKEPEAGVKEVKYALEEKDTVDEMSWQDIGTGVEIHKGDAVYVQVKADEDNDYAITKVTSKVGTDGEDETATKEDGKDYYKFTMPDDSLALTVKAAKSAYGVTVNYNSAEYSEPNEDIVFAWDPETPVTDKKVPAGRALSFTVSVKEEKINDLTIDTVTYNIGSNEMGDVPEENGVYSIPANVIDDNVTINIKTREYAKPAIKFVLENSAKGAVINGPSILVDGAAITDPAWDNDSMTATVSEKNVITFTIDTSSESGYTIGEVSYTADSDESVPKKKKVLEPGKDGVYTLGNVKENITVTVTPVINKKQANKLTLKLGGSSAPDAYDAVFKPINGGQLDEGFVETKYQAEDTIYTLTQEFYVIFTPKKGYDISQVWSGTTSGNTSKYAEFEEVYKESEEVSSFGLTAEQRIYKVLFKNGAGGQDGLAMHVYVKGKTIDTTKNILFANKSGKLTYKVNTTNTGVSLKTGTSNTYVAVAEQASILEFSVTANNGYKPVVKYTDVDEALKESKAVAGKSTTVYQYELPISELPDDVVITLEDAVQDAALTLTYSEDEVKIASARIGAKALDIDDDITEAEGKPGSYNVLIPHGETLTIAFEALDNCKITSATQTGNKKVTTKAAGFEVSIKADALTTPQPYITIVSEKLYKAELSDTTNGSETTLEAVKNVYTVDYDHTYTTQVFHGNTEGASKIDKIVVLDGKKVAEGVEASVNSDGESTSATIKLSDKVQNKKLTVNLYADGNASKAAVAYTLSVLPVITKVEVTGAKKVNGVNTITQTIDTEIPYTVKLTPKTANASILNAVSDEENKDEFTVALNGSVLTVTTPQDKAKSAKIKFYTVPAGKEDTEDNRVYIPADKGGELTVVCADQLSTSVKPTMKLASSDDTTLTLTLGAPKTVVAPEQGKVYYKVTVTDADAAKTTTTDAEKLAEIRKKITGEEGALGKEGSKTEYVEVTGLTQPYTVTVNNADPGSGSAWKYNVEVQLIQTKAEISGNAISEPNAVLASSGVVNQGKNPYETKNPYYEDNLKLTKGTTTIYTGQKVGKNNDQNGVLVATAKFSGKTTFTTIAKAEDVSAYGELDVSVVGDKIYAKANPNLGYSDSGWTTPGTHKIVVYAEAPAGMQPATATINVTVVQGIEGLSVAVPTTSLYKADKKAASLKATVNYLREVTYQEDEENTYTYLYPYTPKTKKVKYEIVGKNGETLPAESTLKKVTVKNGTITVDKNYVVSKTVTDNQFRVKVIADDYAYNENDKTRYALSDVITITEQAQPIGEVVLARPNYSYSDDNGRTIVDYTVLARNGAAMTAEQLRGAYMYVLAKGTPETTKFTDDDILDSSCFTFASSNKAAIEVYAGGYTYVKKPAKNVKLTVTANDGSKAKATMTVTVNYAETQKEGPGELALNLWTDHPSHKECYALNNPSMTLEYDGTMGTIVNVEVLKRNEDYTWDTVSDYTNFKVTATNAKVFTSGQYNEQLQIVTTKKNADVKLTYSYQDGKKSVSKTVTYHLVNKGFDKAKAPKVTLKRGLVANYYDPTPVKGTITNLASGDTFTNKRVLVEVDLSAASAKTLVNYMDLSDALQSPQDCYVDRDGTFEFSLNDDIRAGSYKLKFTVGHIDREAESDPTFVPDYQATTVTVKATAPKAAKGSFKLTAKYTLSLADSKANFAYSNKQLNFVKFDETLLNANISGQDNHFTEYFKTVSIDGDVVGIELDTDKVKAGVAAGKTLNEIVGKDNLTGYVTYTASYGTGIAYTEVTETVKITVTLKDADNAAVLKYTATSPTVLNDRDKVEANIVIKAGGQAQNIAYAYVEKDSLNNSFVGSGDCDVNTVTVSTTTKPAAGKHKLTLYVVPEGSTAAAYVADVMSNNDSNPNAEAVITAIKAKGVKLTPTVTVKAADTTTGKIKVSATKVVFDKSRYDANHNYWVDIPYTKTIDSDIEIADIKVKDGNLFDGSLGFGTWEDEGVLYINACISKEAIASLIAKEGTKKVNWGKKDISVPVTVTFMSGKEEEEGSKDYGSAKKEESITFKVTMPQKPDDTKFDDIVAKITSPDVEKDIMDIDWPSAGEWQWIDNVDKTDDGYTELEHRLNGIKWDIIGNIKRYLPTDGNVFLEYTDNIGNTTDDYNTNVKYTPASADKGGSVVVTLRLVDMTDGKYNEETGEYDYKDAKSETLTYTHTIPAIGKMPNDPEVINKVRGWITGINADSAITINNSTTSAEVLKYLRDKAKVELTENLNIYVVYFNNQDNPATDAAPGQIIAEIKVADVEYDYGEYWFVCKEEEDFNRDYEDDERFLSGIMENVAPIKIPKLDDYDATVTKIQTALRDDFTATNYTTQEQVMNKIKEAIDNKDITAKWQKKTDEEGKETKEDEYTLTKATAPTDDGSDGKGKIEGKIVLSNPKSKIAPEKKDVEISIEIAPLKKADVVIDEVAAAVVTPENARTFAASNDEVTIKKAITDAAKAAIPAEPYAVRIKDGSFEFTKVTWNTPGKIAYTLEIVPEDGGDPLEDNNGKLTLKESGNNYVTLAAKPELQTAEEALNEIVKAVFTDGDSTKEVKDDTLKAYFAKDTADLDKLVGDIAEHLKGLNVGGDSSISVNVKTINHTSATFIEQGTYTFIFCTVKGDEKSKDIQVTLTCAKKESSLDDAEKVVKEIYVNDKYLSGNHLGDNEFGTYNIVNDEGRKQQMEDAILLAAQTAVVNTFGPDVYKVTVETPLGFTTKPTLNSDGEAGITLKVEEDEEGGANRSVSFKWFAKVPQTDEEALQAVKDAVAGLTIKASDVADLADDEDGTKAGQFKDGVLTRDDMLKKVLHDTQTGTLKYQQYDLRWQESFTVDKSEDDAPKVTAVHGKIDVYRRTDGVDVTEEYLVGTVNFDKEVHAD